MLLDKYCQKTYKKIVTGINEALERVDMFDNIGEIIYTGTTISKEGNAQRSLTLAEISEFMENTLIRGEQLEDRMLDEMLAKSRARNMKILETEWADHKDMWEWMLQQGKTPREALDFLESFA